MPNTIAFGMASGGSNNRPNNDGVGNEWEYVSTISFNESDTYEQIVLNDYNIIMSECNAIKFVVPYDSYFIATGLSSQILPGVGFNTSPSISQGVIFSERTDYFTTSSGTIRFSYNDSVDSYSHLRYDITYYNFNLYKGFNIIRYGNTLYARGQLFLATSTSTQADMYANDFYYVGHPSSTTQQASFNLFEKATSIYIYSGDYDSRGPTPTVNFYIQRK